MPSRSLTIGLILVSLTEAGILGNVWLLSRYAFIYCTEGKLRHVDLILKNLFVANCLTLLSRGTPQTLVALGMKFFLDDLGCKLIFYLHRVARGVSLGTTCILSGFQAITVSPSRHQWMKLKAKAPKYIRFCAIICWTLHMLVRGIVPLHITDGSERQNHTKTMDLGYCSGTGIDRNVSLLHLAVFSSFDVLTLGLMFWASGSMMSVLYRHKQTILHIHSTKLPPKRSSETRATQSVLTLVSTFFFFSALSSFFTFYIACSDEPGQWLVSANALVAACFPALRPFVLTSTDPGVSRLVFFFFCLLHKINHFHKLVRSL